METWVDVKGYEGLYTVSNLGNVRSKHKRGVSVGNMKFNKGTGGYSYVHLHKNKQRKIRSVHSLVANAFIENKENKPQVNHINFIKTDNTVENLEWVTPSENGLHSFRNSDRKSSTLGKYGALHHSSKIVRQMDLMGNLIAEFHGQREAERMTGVHSSKISLCMSGKRKTSGGFIWK
jgi:hypothetical protein